MGTKLSKVSTSRKNLRVILPYMKYSFFNFSSLPKRYVESLDVPAICNKMNQNCEIFVDEL